MVRNKDTLSLVEKTWRFDSKVAKKFDTHVNQSIPHYLDLQSYTVKLSEWFLKDNTLVYDLGCSTGETIKQILSLNISTKFSIVGFDNSQKMIDLAKRKIFKIIKNNKRVKVDFQRKDITKINLKKFAHSPFFPGQIGKRLLTTFCTRLLKYLTSCMYAYNFWKPVYEVRNKIHRKCEKSVNTEKR